MAAIDIGLDIPATLISARRDSVASFIQEAKGNVVVKAVKHGFLLRENEVWVATTQRLAPNYTVEFESFAQVPMVYQNEIKKEYDIRIVVVLDKVFATAIHSQDSEETSVDWRVSDIKQIQLHHERIPILESLKHKCKSLVRFFSLKYSSMDFALGKDGVYYFLELNPNGQWAWIEQLAGHPIRDAIIDALAHHGDYESRNY